MSVAPSSFAAHGVGYSFRLPSLVPQEITCAQTSPGLDCARRVFGEPARSAAPTDPVIATAAIVNAAIVFMNSPGTRLRENILLRFACAEKRQRHFAPMRRRP